MGALAERRNADLRRSDLTTERGSLTAISRNGPDRSVRAERLLRRTLKDLEGCGMDRRDARARASRLGEEPIRQFPPDPFTIRVPSLKGSQHATPIHFRGRVVAQLVRAGEVPRRSLVRASGRRIEGFRISRSRVRVSPALPVSLGAHGRWPRATGTVAQERTTEHGVAVPRPMVRRGRGGAETRRRDAGANPAGPGTLW